MDTLKNAIDAAAAYSGGDDPLAIVTLRADEAIQLLAEIERMNQSHLAPKHTGMKISARGVLGRIRDGRYYEGLNFGCGEMLRHLEEMAERFYSGDVKAVDEFLQLYDLDEHRPDTLEKPAPTFVFLSGKANPLNLDASERRFMVVMDDRQGNRQPAPTTEASGPHALRRPDGPLERRAIRQCHEGRQR